MLVMVVFFIAFRWIHLSTPLIRLFLLVLILLLMPTLNFLFVGLMVNVVIVVFFISIQMVTFVIAVIKVFFVVAVFLFVAVPNFFAGLVGFGSFSVPLPLPMPFDFYLWMVAMMVVIIPS